MLAPGDRCFAKWAPAGGYTPAIFLGSTPQGECRVLPDGETTEVLLPEKDVQGRGNTPLSLFRQMGKMLFSHPQSYATRQALSNAGLERFAAYEGLTGLAAAGVDLYQYQVETCQRMLEEDRVRFLLADEVGLGKTIEAGIVARQLLLDGATNIVILAPDSLAQQWSHELVRRLGFTDKHPVKVVPFGKLRRVPANPDLLIVDEAHELCRSRDLYDSAKGVIAGAQHLMLLSATPPTEDNAEFANLLHLVDPNEWREKDAARLQNLLDARVAVSSALASMTIGASPRRLERATQSILEILSNDTVGLALAKQLLSAIQQSDELLDSSVAALREHLHEHYRLSRRMIRSSRRTVLASLPYGRGSLDQEKFPRIIKHPILSVYRKWCADWFDSWRNTLPVGETECLAEFARVASTSRQLLAEYARCRLNPEDGDGLSEVADYAVTRSSPSPEERDWLLRAAEFLSVDEDEIDEMCHVLKGLCVEGSSVVAFGTDELLLAAVSRGLTGLGVPAKMTSELANPGELLRGSVLLGGPQDEQGLNLQKFKDVVFLDIPWDFVRLEQRIGRLDRIGRKSPFRIHVFWGAQQEGDIGNAFLRLLEDGVEIFCHSISDIQQKLGDELESILQRVRHCGSTALLDTCPTRETVTALRNEVESARAFEEIERDPSESQRRYNQMSASDSAWEKTRSAVDTTLESWGLSVLRHPNGARTYRLPAKTRLPALANDKLRTVLPYDKVATVHQATAVFERDQAEAIGSTVAGPGDRLFDTVFDLATSLEDGQVFGTWRVVGGRPDQAHFVFSVDFIAGFDDQYLRQAIQEGTLAGLSLQRLIRQGRSLLPLHRMRVNALFGGDSLREPDAEIDQIANLPYTPARDFPIHARERRLLGAIAPNVWAKLCSELPSFATPLARRKLECRLDLARRRISTDETHAGIMRGVDQPVLKMDAVGLIVLAGKKAGA